jgi:uncharacterized tellurite resistance protein B-like protein
MVNSIKNFFHKYIQSPSDNKEDLSEHSLQIATAALLIEMMRVDATMSPEERRTVTETIQTKFNLSKQETELLMKIAEEKIHKATGYFEFTSLINKGFTYDQKVRVIEHLWEVAFSDASLDKYEEHMVRKIADLIYIKHEDFIEAKLTIKKKLSL